MDSDSIFLSLNGQQAEAVREIEKPVIVIAGAGSGKTLTVASKIAYLVSSGMKAENILALTFNEKAAEELSGRVLSMLGSVDDLQVSTFHSFCNQVIQDNILDTKLNANFSVMTDTAQLVYFVRNINRFGIEYLEFNHEPYTLAEEVKKFISRCKDESISPSDIEGYIRKNDVKLEEEEQAELNSLKDMLKIYKAYEEYKEKRNMLDFGDMLSIVHHLLKSKPAILKRYKERFRYVIVDEFQDTNYVQLQIVGMLSDGKITVVGDDDQSIYRFRGAYLTNIAEFKKMFPNFVEKSLEQNYRSTRSILEVANSLIEKKPERVIKKLFTENQQGEKVSLVEAQTDASQASYILGAVKEFLRERKPQDIAILCRRRSSAEPIAELFRKHGVPFNFVGESSFFSEPIVKDAIAYIKAAVRPEESSAEIVRVMQRFVYDIRQSDISRFNSYAYRKGMDLYEALSHLDEIQVEREKFMVLKSVLDSLIKSGRERKVLDFVHGLLFETDFYRFEIALENKRNVSLLNQFYRMASEFCRLYPDGSLLDFSDYISLASNFEVQEEDVSEGAVTISTIHGVKGMQFPVVIIPDAVERKLPTTYIRDKFPLPVDLIKGVRSEFDEKELHLQEERRLFYVAITRAKEKLIITYARRYGENKTDSRPSKFLDEIGISRFEKSEACAYEAEVEDSVREKRLEGELMKSALAAIRRSDFDLAIEKILVMAKMQKADTKGIISRIAEPAYEVEEEPSLTVENPVFSVSQFSTYKRCPKAYRYRYVLRVPGKPRYYFDFGSSIHNVVEELTKMIRDGNNVSHDIALKLLEKHWDPKGYESAVDEKRDYEEAKNILKVFLEENKKTGTQIVDIERDFETKVDGVGMKGRIDRIDTDGSDFIVIDYKTAKKVSSPRELREDMQLLLYSIVTEQIHGKRPAKVGLWFLRSNEKVFVEVNDEALEALRKEIGDIAGKIGKCEFHATPGWECRNCDYDCLCDDCKK